jgi:nitroreductase
MIDVAAADELLTTTRAVRRRLDLDRPVPREVILECVAVAQQAPTGSNAQNWAFVVVTDEHLRAQLAELYRSSGEDYLRSARDQATDDRSAKVYDSALYLAQNLQRVPVHVIPCVRRRIDGAPLISVATAFGSIIPAAWNFVLAARARGLGTTWTTLHLHREKEAAELLGIPDDVTQVALLPLAYYTGSEFSRADRPPPQTITHWDRWADR